MRPLPREAQVTIVNALRLGHYMDTAAALAGVTTSRLHAMIRAGVDPESEHHEFAMDVRRAIAEAENEALEALKEVALGDAKVMQWFLERRYPERWSLKVQHVVREELDGAIARVEALAERIGEENLALVLHALAGGTGSAEAPSEADAGLH